MSRLDELRELQEEIKVANKQFNEATGLYIDAYSYKIKYLQTLYLAIRQEYMKEEETNEVHKL